MTDAFAHLVFKANPASSHNSHWQYQRANEGSFRLTARSTVAGSFFFNDEDEGDPPYSTFASAHSTQVKESNLHLSGQAAPLAGASKASLRTNGVPQGWAFDQDDPPFPPLSHRSPFSQTKKGSHRRGRWPWEKEQVLAGEHVVFLNNPDATANFLSNYVSTTNYNMVTLVPTFLFVRHLTCPFYSFQSNSPNTPIYVCVGEGMLSVVCA